MRQWQRDLVDGSLDLQGRLEGLLETFNGTSALNGVIGRLFNIRHGSGDHDVIDGSGRADYLVGHRGRDKVDGGAGADVIRGGGDHDRLMGGLGHDSLLGGGGHDTMLGGRGADELFGGNGNDKIGGDAGPDVLAGGRGHDWLAGGDGADTVVGGAGRDTLEGGEGSDVLAGGPGADVYLFEGDFGDDQVIGFEPGRDKIAISGASLDDLTFTRTALGIRIDITARETDAASAPAIAPATQFAALSATAPDATNAADTDPSDGLGPILDLGPVGPAGGSVTIVGAGSVTPTDITFTAPSGEDPYSPIVTTAEDKYEENPSPDDLSLREALDIAASDPDGNYFITFDSTVFADATTINLDAELGTLRVSGNVTIEGPSGEDGMPLVTVSGDTGANDVTEAATLTGGAEYFPGQPVDAPDWTPMLTDVESSLPTGVLDDNVPVMLLTPGTNLRIFELVITGGAAIAETVSSVEGNGGGLTILGDSSVQLTRVVIGGNYASNNGGGIYLDGGALDMEGTSGILNNVAGNDGGGAYLSNTSTTATFYSGDYGFMTGNSAGGVGGGLFLTEAQASFDYWDFIGNASAYEGGGAYVSQDDSSQLALQEAYFINNTASIVGAVWDGPDNMTDGNTQYINNTQPDVSGPYAEMPDLF